MHSAHCPSHRQRRSSTLLVLALLVLVTQVLDAQIHRVSDEQRRSDLAKEADLEKLIMVPMRDGVRLATDVYVPKDAEGPLPAVFWRTPYNTSPLAGSNPDRPSALLKFALDSVRRGYAFVIQNERGKFFSEGEWEILGRPRTDGYDALTWIADQPWSNGRVATLGCSSTAEWQMGLAAMGHPAHAAAVPMGQGAGIGRMGPFYEQGNFYRGGAIQLAMVSWLHGTQEPLRPTFPAGTPRDELVRMAQSFDLAPRLPVVDWKTAFRHLPVEDMLTAIGGSPDGVFSGMVERGPDHADWYQGGLYHDSEDFKVPALWMNSWFDLSVGPNLELYNHVRENASLPKARDNQFMVIAPTLHCAMYRLRDPLVVGDLDMGNADFGMDEMLFSFLDLWTKGEATGFADEYPNVLYYSMGVNEWRRSATWPPPGMRQVAMYLGSGAGANSLAGDGRLMTQAGGDRRERDQFTYDPMNPVTTRGGNFCCLGGEPEGSYDQREVEARQDVLVYTSDRLDAPLDVAGPIEVVLYVSSDAKDTDFTVKLVDVYPDGRAFNLDDSILRVRYREGFDREVFMADGEVYEIRIGPLVTANVFGAGHRVRVEVSSSNFPRYDRNLNTGGRNHDETQGVVASNVVHHSEQYPSRIVLPVLSSE